MYFHTDSARTLNWLSAVMEGAADNERRLRIDVRDGSLYVKVGEGAWSAPLYSTDDPYRDASFDNVVPAKDHSAGMTLPEVMKDLIDMDASARLDGVLRNHYNKVIQEGLDA